MGTYYYVKDRDEDGGYLPIYEDDYIAAIKKITKRSGIEISDEMILEEVKRRWKRPNRSSRVQRKSSRED